MKPYVTEPLTNFLNDRNIQDFQKAMTDVESQLGKEYPLMIGSEEIITEDKVTVAKPS